MDRESAVVLNKMSQQFEDLSMRLDSALGLLWLLATGTEELEPLRKEILEALENYDFNKNTHAGFPLAGLNLPSPQQTTVLRNLMIDKAAEYYTKLDAGEDPGPAKASLDAISGLESDIFRRLLRVDLMVATMEMERLVKGWGRNDD